MTGEAWLVAAVFALVNALIWLSKRGSTQQDRAYQDARTDVELARAAEMGFHTQHGKVLGLLEAERAERRADADACRNREAMLQAKNVEQDGQIQGLLAQVAGLLEEVAKLRGAVQSGGVYSG